jgi:hypothetical protein
MPATEECVQVAFPLPRTVYERVERAARDGQRSLDDELAVLVESGLNAELSHQERFDRLAEMYRARLAREGQLNQTPEEVMAELRAIREKIADELYPD